MALSWVVIQAYAVARPQLSIAALLVIVFGLEWVKAGYKPEALKKK